MSSTLEKGYTRWLREQNYRCVLCKERSNLLPSELQLRKHLLAVHANEVGDGESSESCDKLALLLARARPMKSSQPGPQATAGAGAGPSSPAKIGGQPKSPQGRRQAEESEAAPPSKKARTPTNSNHGDPVPATTSATPGPSETRRSRARSNPIQQQNELDFPRRTQGPGKLALWNEGQPGLSRRAANPSLIASPRPGKAAASPFSPRFGSTGPSRPGHGLAFDHEAHHPPAPLMSQFADYVSQPNTQPISSEQLVVEVKGIYAGLVMVESKCIEVDTSQNVHAEQPIRLTHEQWQALIALHRTLLHEHHDFFLASQHPSASAALRRLATKYAMPARMWRHGIHSFLELLRRRLPDSLEHMLTFIYLAYGTMALLYETVPAFEETWIECLGDLGRYRMAIEEENQTDREVWTGVSRRWYAKASDKAPTTGRLYHHLAILARPNAVQQLYLYCKSLSVASPFPSAKESILTLFDPILSGALRGPSAADLSLVRAVGILFKGNMNDEFQIAKEAYVSTLDNWIHRQTKRWMEPGSFYALSLCCAQLEFSYNDGILMQIVKHIDSGASGDAAAAALPSADFKNALDITTDTDEITLKRFGDNNVLPYIHCRLAFLFFFSDYPPAMDHIKGRFPWKLFTLLLNFIMGSYSTYERVESTKLPLPAKGDVRPLPEDWALRGFPFSEDVYPWEFFKSEQFDDTEKLFELASMTEERKERILWYGYQLATQGAATRTTCLSYDSETHRFSVGEKYDVDLEPELSGSIASSPTAMADDPEELPDADEDTSSAEAGAEVPNMIAIQQ